MISRQALHLMTVAGLGVLVAAPAMAQEEHYFYGGLSAGQSRAKFDEHRVADAVLGGGLTLTDLNHDERDRAYKVFGGYQFNRNWGLEAGYFNLGRFNFHGTTAPAGTLDGQMKLHGFNLDLVGTLPMSDKWSAIARVGAQYAKVKDTFSGTGAAVVTHPNPEQSKTNYKAGLGLQYAITPGVMVRGEVERFRIDDAVGNADNVHMVSVGLVIPFGRGSAPARRVQAEPAPVMAAAEPVREVIAAPPPPPVVLRRVSFSAESLYGFDQSALQPSGMAALDTFAREVEGIRFDMIQVVGHTDRIGPPAYNQALSTQRAEGVKSYLVTSGKFDPAKVNAVGKGESTPVTSPDDCKGQRKTAKLVACLAPDRRVDIEVIGTR